MFFCLVKVKTKANHTGSADSYLSNVPDQVKAISPKHIIGNRGALYSVFTVNLILLSLCNF